MEDFKSDRRTRLRSAIIVTQVKMGDERRYFFGYAKNLSHTGVFVQTISPKDVGEEFNIEFTIPKTELKIFCKCKVVWNRRFSESTAYEPGMGLQFIGMAPELTNAIEDWVKQQVEAALAEEL